MHAGMLGACCDRPLPGAAAPCRQEEMATLRRAAGEDDEHAMQELSHAPHKGSKQHGHAH